jgi:N-acetylglucosamine-6-phosphate deacetylase
VATEETAVGAVRLRSEGVVTAGKILRGHDLLVRDGRVVGTLARAVGAPGYRLRTVQGYVGAALVDIHTHGAFGVAYEAADADALRHVRRALRRRGVGAFVASFPSLEPAQTAAALARLAPWVGRREPGLATLLGVHLEGPYLAPTRRGAHPAQRLRRPDRDEITAWVDGHPGTVRMVTMAPELPGAEAVIRALRERAVVVAIGHTDADAAAVEAAFGLGARHATHLWNAMGPLGHRAPGAVGAFLASGGTTVELICDGHHIDPRVLALTVRLVGPHRVALVTDAMAAAGLGDGVYRLGDLEARVVDGVARAPDGALAGSTLVLDVAVANAVRWQLAPWAWAQAMASAVPARVIGAEGYGTLAAGAYADLVRLDETGQVAALDAWGEAKDDATEGGGSGDGG